MRDRVLVLLVMSVVAVYGLVDATSEPTGFNELVKEKGEFKRTRVRPEADLARFTKLQPETVVLTVQDPGRQEEPTGSLVGQGGGGGIMPSYEDLTQLKQILNEAILAGIDSNTSFELTESAEPGTLVLHAAVKEALCDRSLRIKTADGEPSPVLTEATIVFDLIDAETGVILAHFEERRRNKKPKGASISDASGPWPWAAVWAQTAAADLCSELKRMSRETG